MSIANTRGNVGRLQQVTRIPEYRPGTWVKIRDFAPGDAHSGKVRLVRSLTCAISEPDQQLAVWRVHFGDGRCVKVANIERLASDGEIRDAQRRFGERR